MTQADVRSRLEPGGRRQWTSLYTGADGGHGLRQSPRATRASAGRRTGASANLSRQLRSVNTSDVVSTSAPQTTWTLLSQMLRRLSTVNAPSVACTLTSATSNAAGRTSSRSIAQRATR